MDEVSLTYAAPMTVEIVIKKKDFSIERMTFDKQSIMIGRSPGNDILLEDGGVSRYHARIWIEDGVVVLQDLNSTNGSFVNGAAVQKSRVGPFDEVVIGDYALNIQVRVPVEPLPGDKPRTPMPVHEELPLEALAPPSDSLSPPVLHSNGSHVEELTVEPVEPPPTAAPAAASPPSREEERAKENESFYWRSLQSFLGPIWDFINDDSVTEIMVNGPREIYIERKGQLLLSDRHFTTDQVNAAILNIAQYVGRRVSEEEPYLDARLPDGSRVAVLLPPCSRKGASISIRKFAKEKLTLDKLIQFGSLTEQMVRFLQGCVVLKKNIVISGGTSSGKTSLLNVVSGLIPDDERILTIEDSAELQLRQAHVVPMETKPPDKKGRGEVTIRDLVRASLRMRPDRIIVGEIRSGEALDLLQAMNTGHSGSMCTVHASSPPQALTRLETLALFSGLEIPVRALREQVSTAIDYIVQAARLPDHSRKVTHISEVVSLSDDGSYRVHDVFKFVRTGTTPEGKIIGEHRLTGYRPTILDELELAGLTNVTSLFPAGNS